MDIQEGKIPTISGGRCSRDNHLAFARACNYRLSGLQKRRELERQKKKLPNVMKLKNLPWKNAGSIVGWGFVQLIESSGQCSVRLAAQGYISSG